MQAIRALADSEIVPLLAELSDYCDGNVWDRKIERDQEQLGSQEFAARLSADMQRADGRRQAAHRLISAGRFSTPELRDQFLADLSIVLGEKLP